MPDSPSSDSIAPSTKRRNKKRIRSPYKGPSDELVQLAKTIEVESVAPSATPSEPRLVGSPENTTQSDTRPAAHTPTREEWLAGKKKDPKQGRKIAIVGSAPSSNRLAPFDDPAWEIWACSPANMKILPRVDAWFELHKTQLYPEHIAWGGPYVEWLRSQSFTLYMQDKGIASTATPYPLEDMLKRFSGYFFTSSFAYMLALMIAQHEDGNTVSECGIYGADMATTKEYVEQMPAAHHFMWMASKAGIKVSTPPESDLIQPPWLYGYFEATAQGRKWYVRKLEIEGRVAAARQQAQEATDTIKHLTGCLDAEDYHWRRWHNSSK